MSEDLQSRPVSDSQSERAEAIFPADSNALGTLFGGRLMQFIDLVGAMAASRHARTYVVTASMDHLDFVAPVRVGELLILKASVNRAFKTSMEVGVRAMVEDVREQKVRHVSSAYLTFVAVDKMGTAHGSPAGGPRDRPPEAPLRRRAATARDACRRNAAEEGTACDV